MGPSFELAGPDGPDGPSRDARLLCAANRERLEREASTEVALPPWHSQQSCQVQQLIHCDGCSDRSFSMEALLPDRMVQLPNMIAHASATHFDRKAPCTLRSAF